MPTQGKHITEETSDQALLAALTVFYEICEERATDLGLSVEDLDDLKAVIFDYAESLTEVTAASFALKAAVTAKKEHKATVRGSISRFARKFRADLAIPDALLANLMLPAHKPSRTHSAPALPVNLQGRLDEVGNIDLRWGRNGNTERTTFLVQAVTHADSVWRIVAATNRTRAKIATPAGSFVTFRVLAQRNGRTSQPSQTQAFWGEDVRAAAS